LVPPVIAFTSFAAIIASYRGFVIALAVAVVIAVAGVLLGVLDRGFPFYNIPRLSSSLLLVFRTEASYSRFEEGRKAWMKVIAGTNDLARQVLSGVDNSVNAPLKREEGSSTGSVMAESKRERCSTASRGERERKWGEKKKVGPVTVINWDPQELSPDLNPDWIQKQVKG
jgi:predicted membrane chloride channel (bestrophin family)